jgi:PAS domain S-box-containing protein
VSTNDPPQRQRPTAGPSELTRLKSEALVALRQGRLDLADELLHRGDVTLQELTHNLRVYQVELEAQAQELRESQARTDRTARQFRRLFESLPLPALVVDRLGVVLSVNRQAEQLMEISAGTALKPALRRLLADDASRVAVQAALLRAERDGHARADGVRFPHPDRQEHTADVLIELLGLEGAAGAHFVLLFVDETERIRDQQSLADTNRALKLQQRESRRLAAVARSTQSIVVVTDPTRRIVWVNEAFTRLSGFEVAEVVGRTLAETLYGPATDPRTLARMNAALEAGDGYAGIEVLCYDRHRHPFWVISDMQPVRGDDGEIEQYVSVQRDITDRKADESRLRESEAWQRAVFEATPGMVAVVRPDGRLQNLNRAGVELLQADGAEQLAGRPLAEFLVGDGPLRYRRLHAAAMLGHAGRDEFDLVGLAGHAAVAEFHAAPLWRGGSVASVVVVSRDLTAEREARSLRVQKEAAEAANHAKTEFLSRMSHELRTPLNAVLGFAQLMQIDIGSAPVATQQSRLAHIERAGWHLLAMINDVLDLSRIESDHIELHLETLPLHAVVDDALMMVQGAAQSREVVLKADVDPALMVRCDALRLKQVVTNLLSNAVKYNRQGGWVKVSATPEDERVLLSVADSGDGLTEAQLAHLFEPFNRLGVGTQIEGTGIGLVIARRLTELMDGRLEVSSAPGEGCTFTVCLPAVGDAVPRAGDDPPAPPVDLPTRDCRVLYIEDVASNVELVRHALAGSRWTMKVARTGADGLAQAREAPPDLVLLDLQLPDTDGREVLARLRADPRTATLPCVVITASMIASDDLRWADGAQVLTKPVRIAQLRQALADAVEAAPPSPGP